MIDARSLPQTARSPRRRGGISTRRRSSSVHHHTADRRARVNHRHLNEGNTVRYGGTVGDSYRQKEKSDCSITCTARMFIEDATFAVHYQCAGTVVIRSGGTVVRESGNLQAGKEEEKNIIIESRRPINNSAAAEGRGRVPRYSDVKTGGRKGQLEEQMRGGREGGVTIGGGSLTAYEWFMIGEGSKTGL